LSKEEVLKILHALINQKHRTMLSLVYACGLRRGELLGLKPENIDSQRHLLIILNAKGRKDRVVPISDKVITMLREYYKAYKPKVWLFEGQEPGKQYSEKSIQSVLKQAIEKAKISKPVKLCIGCDTLTLHTFWNQEQTSGIFRNCWGIRAQKQPRFTHTLPKQVCKRLNHLLMICNNNDYFCKKYT
jgi:integrase